MATIVTRAGKGSALTHDELDDNATNLNTELTSTTTLATAALPKTGGAMTGAITTNSTFDGVDIATRDGVLTTTTTTANAALPKTGGAMTGAITTNSTFDGVDIATRDGVLTSTTTTANAALPKAGGTMAGAIAMGTSKITGMGDPAAAQDAATKAYVDANSGIASVVADTTPQLGGDLDVNGQSLVTVSNGNIVLDPNGTGGISIEGDGTTPSNFPERLARLAKGDVTIDSNQTDAWWGTQLMMKDNTDDVFGMVGRVDTSQKVYGYIIQMDPNGSQLNSSAFAGDYGFYFNMEYEAGAGSNEWNMVHNVFGADDGYYLNSYASNHGGYAYTPFKIRGNPVELSAHTGGAFGGGTQGPALKVQVDHVDLNGLYLKDTSGTLQIQDVFDVTITSGGTTSMNTHNKSATALGNRVTVGDTSTAHTAGDGFLVRRGTGSGFQEQFKVNTASSQTRVTATQAFNITPVAFAGLHSSPGVGDLAFLTTDGAGALKNMMIYHNGSIWLYVHDNSTVATS
jgi:hypothetical protein